MRLNQTLLLTLFFLLAFPSQAIELNSIDISEGKTLKKAQKFNQWGCSGENSSPELSWSEIPIGTKSFAVTMYDPDAPTGSGWWHWLVVNLPANTQGLPANSGVKGGANLPEGASMVNNDFGFKGFGGACPPAGSAPHNYQITVYALDVAHIELPDNATAALAGYNIYQHLLGKATLTAPTNAR